MSDGKVIISTKLDNSGVEKGLAGMQTAVKKFAGTLGLAFSTAAIINYGKVAIQTASQMRSAYTGLRSIVEGQGRSFAEAKGFVQDFISDGLVPATNAVTAYKNLAMRGYDDTQIQQVMLALKDSAAYGRQASLTLGDAVASATEGLKNENSILVDNAGVTKNVSMMWKDYAKSIGVTVDSLTQQQKIQAEVSGILHETRFQTGDAAKVAGEYEGQVLGLKFALNDLKIAFGNMLIPINQYVIPAFKALINAVTRLLNTVGQISGALFGTAVKRQEQVAESAAAAAEAENELAKATKDAGKAAKNSLGAFDELNVLQKKTESGTAPTVDGGVGGVTPPAIAEADTETLPHNTAKMVTQIQQLLAPLQNINFDNLSAALGRLKASFAPLGDALFKGLEWGYSNVLVPLAQWAAEALAPLWIDYLADVCDHFAVVLEILKPLGTWVWENFLKPLGQWTGQELINAINTLREGFGYITDWLVANKEKIQELFSALGPLAQIVADTIMETLSNIRNFVQSVFQNIIGILIGIVDFVVGVLTGDWEQAWGGLKAVVKGVVNIIVALFARMWETLSINFTKGLEALKAVWELMWGAIKNIFITSFDAMTSAFTCVINGWIGIVEGFANMFVRAINKIIESINSISFDVPDWDIFGDLAGRSFGFSLPSIPELKLPRLATGAVIPANREFMAVLGDQKRGMNIEAPADLIRQIVREESGEREITIRFEGSMAQLVRILKPELDREAHRRGTRLVTGGIG